VVGSGSGADVEVECGVVVGDVARRLLAGWDECPTADVGERVRKISCAN